MRERLEISGTLIATGNCLKLIQYVLVDILKLDVDPLRHGVFSPTYQKARSTRKKGPRYVHFTMVKGGFIYVEIKPFVDEQPATGTFQISGPNSLYNQIIHRYPNGKIMVPSLLESKRKANLKKGVVDENPTVPPEILEAFRLIVNEESMIARNGMGSSLAEILDISSHEAGPIIQRSKAVGLLVNRGSKFYEFIDPAVIVKDEPINGDDLNSIQQTSSSEPEEFFKVPENIARALDIINNESSPKINPLCDILNNRLRFGLMHSIAIIRPIIIGWQEKQGFLVFTGIKVSLGRSGLDLIDRYRETLKQKLPVFSKEIIDAGNDVTPEIVESVSIAVLPEESNDITSDDLPDEELENSSSEKNGDDIGVYFMELVELAREYRSAEDELKMVDHHLAETYQLLKLCITDLRGKRKEKLELTRIINSSKHKSAIDMMAQASRLSKPST